MSECDARSSTFSTHLVVQTFRGNRTFVFFVWSSRFSVCHHVSVPFLDFSSTNSIDNVHGWSHCIAIATMVHLNDGSAVSSDPRGSWHQILVGSYVSFTGRSCTLPSCAAGLLLPTPVCTDGPQANMARLMGPTAMLTTPRRTYRIWNRNKSCSLVVNLTLHAQFIIRSDKDHSFLSLSTSVSKAEIHSFFLTRPHYFVQTTSSFH